MPPIITCAAALNPCFIVNGVDFLIESISSDLEFFDDGFASKSKSNFKESFEGLYNLYYEKYGNPIQSSQASSGATSSKASDENNYSHLLNGLKAHTKKARTNPTMSSEFERYVNSDFVTHLHPKEFASFDVLGFWKEKKTMFPVLSHMAVDLISVQSSSVASESAFSTSERVLSIRRTRLTPASLEMCMCLKDHLDAKERKQDKCLLKIPLDFEEDVFDDEVQQNEVIPLSDEEITLDASSEAQCLGDQKSSLLTLKKDLIFDSSHSTKLVGWNQSVECCTWGGVSCDETGHVIVLDLRNESISGGIKSASQWKGLKRLEFLSFGGNFLSGNLPESLLQIPSLLGFWKEQETMFSVLSRMAMDLISIQASSVSSESAFLTSGRVLSIRRTRLTPASLDMCMCLKDHLDAKERKQDKCPLKIPLDFEEDAFDDEVQRNEAIPLSDEEIALDASSECTLSLGGPQYDYMMGSEVEDDY
nr:leucine-rich repeat protein [Tanacetum cinerariifolium]